MYPPAKFKFPDHKNQRLKNYISTFVDDGENKYVYKSWSRYKQSWNYEVIGEYSLRYMLELNKDKK